MGVQQNPEELKRTVAKKGFLCDSPWRDRGKGIGAEKAVAGGACGEDEKI